MMRTAFILAVVLITGCSPRSNLTGRQGAIDITSNFMRTGDTTGLRAAFGDTVLDVHSLSDIIDARLGMIGALGEFQGTRDLHFHSDTESHVTFGFEQGEMTFTLLHDESGKIVLISEDQEPESEVLGDTSGQAATTEVELTDLITTDEFRNSFNSQSQSVRLVSLLSPT